MSGEQPGPGPKEIKGKTATVVADRPSVPTGADGDTNGGEGKRGLFPKLRRNKSGSGPLPAGHPENLSSESQRSASLLETPEEDVVAAAEVLLPPIPSNETPAETKPHRRFFHRKKAKEEKRTALVQPE